MLHTTLTQFKKSILYSICFFIFLLFHCYYYVAYQNQLTDFSFTKLLPYAFIAALISPILAILVSISLVHIEPFISTHLYIKDSRVRWCSKCNTRIFLCAFIVYSLCMLPMFLTFYPGILAYDFSMQITQIMNDSITTHHPLIHTLLLRYFYKLGLSAFGSATIGIALYTLSQLLFLAFTFAYVFCSLYSRKVAHWVLMLQSLFFILFPPSIFLSISCTKDTIYASFTLLFVTAILNSIYDLYSSIPLSRSTLSTLGGSGIMIILFRNNGTYALLAYTFILFFLALSLRTYRPSLRKLFILSCCTLFLGSISLNILQNAVQAKSADPREALSIPLQQFARAYIYHPEEIEEEIRCFLENSVSTEGLYSYKPFISDPVKFSTNSATLLEDPQLFIEYYTKTFINNPKPFIHAFLIQNAGYFNISDSSHAYINNRDGLIGYGSFQTAYDEVLLNKAGISHHSIFPKRKHDIDLFTTNNLYLSIPIISILCSPGIWFYTLLFLVAYTITQKQYLLLLPCSLLGGHFVTLLLGPAVQIRYMFPLMLSIPTILIFVLIFASIQSNKKGSPV